MRQTLLWQFCNFTGEIINVPKLRSTHSLNLHPCNFFTAYISVIGGCCSKAKDAMNISMLLQNVAWLHHPSRNQLQAGFNLLLMSLNKNYPTKSNTCSNLFYCCNVHRLLFASTAWWNFPLASSVLLH